MMHAPSTTWSLAVALGLVTGCGLGQGDETTADGGDGLVPYTTSASGDTGGDDPAGPTGNDTTGLTGNDTADDGSDGPADSGESGDSSDSGEAAPTCGDPPVWCPPPTTTWQWQLTGDLVAADVEMFDIDLFDIDAAQIADLRAEGRVVICYFSAGSHEEWRPDADQFPAVAIGDPLDEWPGERWLDVRDPAVRDTLAARLDLAVDKGCDGVEPDNVDGYANQTGFPLTGADQLDFNRWLADQAHARQLSVGLKNDLDQVEDLLPRFDWALNEECMAYDECDRLAPFIDAGKAVFHVEYVDDPADGPALADTVCPAAQGWSFSSLVKHWDLDAWGIACG